MAAKVPHAAVRTGPRRAPFALLVAGLIVGGLCALLALNTAAAAEELQRHALTQSNTDLSDDVQQLQAQLAAREAPGALSAAASRLGMVPAGSPAFLSIQPDGSVKVLGDPHPATAPPPPPKPVKPVTHKPVKKPTNQHPAKPAKKKPASGHGSVSTAPRPGGTP